MFIIRGGFMQVLVFILSIYIFFKTISYGVYEIKKENNKLRWNYSNCNFHLSLDFP